MSPDDGAGPLIERIDAPVDETDVDLSVSGPRLAASKESELEPSGNGGGTNVHMIAPVAASSA